MKFLDLTTEYKSIKKEIGSAIKRVLESGFFIEGKEVEEFEKEIAKFCGVKYAVGVNSGTDALFLSLKALGIGPGNEVITTPFTFIATAEVIANLGAKPVFIDIEPKTFNIDSFKIEEKITKKTKAIIPVHLFGQMAKMGEIMRIAKKYKIFVIEDVAQSLGAEYKEEKAGTIGDVGCFSFFPSKNLGAYGDGGMVITNNKELADKIRLLRNHGSSPKDKYLNLLLGTNSRLDALQAAVLRVKLEYLEKWNKKRAEIAAYYAEKLKKIKEVETPFVASGAVHTFYSFVIKVKNGSREKLKEHLERLGIQTAVYYPLPLHLQPVFRYLGYKKGDFPVSEKAAKEVLSLPIYPGLSKKDRDYIIKNIREFYV